jgi:hypothetical protein
MTKKRKKKVKKFHVLNCWMFCLRAESFSCSLGVLYRGLGISKLEFLIKKITYNFSALNFFLFLVIKTLDPELDPDPD